MPMIAFMGGADFLADVGQKSSLARLAASAASFARRSSASNRLRFEDVFDQPADSDKRIACLRLSEGGEQHSQDRVRPCGRGAAELRRRGFAPHQPLKPVGAGDQIVLGM